MLTGRARKYLASLERQKFISTKQVEQAIIDSGWEAVPCWLSFHEKYAGYSQIVGHDVAVWGLVHERAAWLPDGRVDIERDEVEEDVYIACADAHPSYGYRLNKSCHFRDEATSFDVFVERQALLWDFSGDEQVAFEELGFQGRVDLAKWMRDEAVVEHVSDSYYRYFVASRILIEEAIDDGYVRVWRKL